jgi:DNA-binding transcriptional MerR regulator
MGHLWVKCIVLTLQYMDDDRFRMAELERRSGMARTTIHLYLREGLLPPPHKTAVNTGLYGPEHLERLALIRRLRSAEFGSLSLARIRRVLDRVEKGVTPEMAVQLDRAVAFGERGAAERHGLSRAGLAEASGVPEARIQEMVEVGLLMPDPFGRGLGFDHVDATVAKACHEAFEAGGLSPADITPVLELIGKIVVHEIGLRDKAVGETRGQKNASIALSLQRAANLLHPYQLSRRLEGEIARRARRAALERGTSARGQSGRPRKRRRHNGRGK